MFSNKFLAVIIILLLVLFFVLWVLSVVVAVFTDIGVAARIFIPGAIWFGFWWLVISRLYNCQDA